MRPLNLLSTTAVIAIAVMAVSCSSDSGSTAPGSSPSSTSQPGSSGGGQAPQSNTGASSLSKMRLQSAFPNLSFELMTGIYEPPDGTESLFVLEQRGRIMAFDNRDDVREAGVFLDIRDRVNSTGQEEGLLGLAFSPDYGSSGEFYVYYSAASPRRSIISRFTASDPAAGSADPSSEFKIMEVMQPFANHNGGQMAFGPDKYLYIGLGDGGSAGDPMGNGQNLNALLGKILRIDVNQSNNGQPYSIPSDNPFVGRNGARAEIWAYGLRNPWRFSFDPETKDLWVADVGQNALEEIDIIRKGANYGWNKTEGSSCYPSGSRDCDKSGLTMPVFEYPRTGGNCSITGGMVYRGKELPSLNGAYVYGDYCSGKIWALRYDGNKITEQMEILDSDIRISSFGVDSKGNIYALAHASRGGIFKIVSQ